MSKWGKSTVEKSGNLEKYESKNPLKQRMIHNFQQTLIQELRENVPGLKQGEKLTLCDVGCGEGIIDRTLLNTFPTLDITGFDLSERAIAFAKELNPEAQYYVKNILDADSTDKYDVVLCTEVLEHLPDPARAINVLKQMTARVCVITVPHEPFFCLGNLLSLKNVTRLGNPKDHINHWTFRSFKKEMEKNGRGGGKFFYSFPWQGYFLFQG
ncbi:Ubiquinone biosynthesis O-methyltransferase, mitochondrial [Firmicutes bacterium ASF500]|nr:Ubiquinone biosynthesis O-methyltransferase, mitochondrial [Firmicutes bacterium ASF500]